MNRFNPDNFGTLPEVADYLRVSIRTVQRCVEERGLKSYKIDGSQQGRILIRWSDLEAWLEARAVERPV